MPTKPTRKQTRAKRARARPESLAALREEMDRRFGRLAVHASGWLQPVLFELLERPLSQPRWRVLSERFAAELHRRAEVNRTSAEQELLIAARQALSLAVPDLAVPARLMDDDGQKAAAHALRQLRRRINELVTRDLLGLDWRRPAEPLSEELPGQSLLDNLETAEQAAERQDRLEALRLQASPLELAVLDALGEGAGDPEIAERLHVVPATVRVLKHRLRKKSKKSSRTV